MPNREDVRDNAAREDVRGTLGTTQRAGNGGGTALTAGAQRGRQIPSDAQIPVARLRDGGPNGEDGDERLANGLGWFSIGLGLAQIFAPGGVARLIGVNDDMKNRSLMRAIGMREIATGVGILSRPRPAGWVRARVGGDMMDLALLGAAMRDDGTAKGKVAMATAAVLGVAALDVVASGRLSERANNTRAARARQGAKMHVAKAITIKTSPEKLYTFWRNFENLPRFMFHLEEVRVINDRRSHWVAKAPAGSRVEWDAEIVEDRPNERIAWRSLPDADVKNSGSVEFRPAPRGRGTEVHVEVHYDPPAGKLGAMVAKLMGEEPAGQIGDDLRRLKQVIETGEVVISDATVAGLGQGPGLLRQRAAQPPRREEVTAAIREARL
jgi:uncharacterized membrane protein